MFQHGSPRLRLPRLARRLLQMERGRGARVGGRVGSGGWGVYNLQFCPSAAVAACTIRVQRQRDWETRRQAGRPSKRATEQPTNRKTDRPTDRQRTRCFHFGWDLESRKMSSILPQHYCQAHVTSRVSAKACGQGNKAGRSIVNACRAHESLDGSAYAHCLLDIIVKVT